MADVVNERPAPLARPEPQPAVSRRRFGAAYLLLAAIVGAAVGLAVVLSTRDDRHSQPVAWSVWAPTTTGTRAVREIARHVSAGYHLTDGSQLAAVIGEPMQVSGGVPVSAILLRSGSTGVREERIDAAFPEAGIFFQLCGTAGDCVLKQGADPSVERLVRRESVELFLYAFHYLPQADYMVAFLPPTPGIPATDPRHDRALFFDRAGFEREIAAPLKTTLPRGVAGLTPATYAADEANAVDGLLAGRLYGYRFQQAANGSALLVLSPIEP